MWVRSSRGRKLGREPRDDGVEVTAEEVIPKYLEHLKRD